MNIPILQGQMTALVNTCADMLRTYADIFYDNQPMDVSLSIMDEDLKMTEIQVPNLAKVRAAVVWPGVYFRTNPWTAKSAAEPAVLTPPDRLFMDVGAAPYTLYGSEINLNDPASWDYSAYADPANREGRDFYIYAGVSSGGADPALLLSANGSAPTGYNETNSRKIGGFHCLAGDIGHETALAAWAVSTAVQLGETRKAVVWDGRIYRCTVAGTTGTVQPNWPAANPGDTVTDGAVRWVVEQHPLDGYHAGDILPASVWDQLHRPLCSPEGMVWVGPIGKWVDIYLQSGAGAGTASRFGQSVTVSRTWENHVGDLAVRGKSLLSDYDFTVAAQGSNQTNLSAPPSATGHHSDPYGRVMISNYGLMDACGAYWQMLADPNGYVSGKAGRMAAGGAAGETMNGPLSRVPVDAAQNTDYTARGCARPFNQ